MIMIAPFIIGDVAETVHVSKWWNSCEAKPSVIIAAIAFETKPSSIGGVMAMASLWQLELGKVSRAWCDNYRYMISKYSDIRAGL